MLGMWLSSEHLASMHEALSSSPGLQNEQRQTSNKHNKTQVVKSSATQYLTLAGSPLEVAPSPRMRICFPTSPSRPCCLLITLGVVHTCGVQSEVTTPVPGTAGLIGRPFRCRGFVPSTELCSLRNSQMQSVSPEPQTTGPAVLAVLGTTLQPPPTPAPALAGSRSGPRSTSTWEREQAGGFCFLPLIHFT